MKVMREIPPHRMNMPMEEPRRSQTDWVVPSSYSWKPTNPLTSRQVQRAEVKPFCAAAKYGYAGEPGGITPESNTKDVMVRSMYM